MQVRQRVSTYDVTERQIEREKKLLGGSVVKREVQWSMKGNSFIHHLCLFYQRMIETTCYDVTNIVGNVKLFCFIFLEKINFFLHKE